jgi:hypothetical protein
MWHAWEIREKNIRFGWKSQNERDNSEDLRVDGRMGSEWILGRLAGGVEWIQLAQDRDRWLATVNTVMNLRVLGPQIQFTVHMVKLFSCSCFHRLTVCVQVIGLSWCYTFCTCYCTQEPTDVVALQLGAVTCCTPL